MLLVSTPKGLSWRDPKFTDKQMCQIVIEKMLKVIKRIKMKKKSGSIDTTCVYDTIPVMKRFQVLGDIDPTVLIHRDDSTNTIKVMTQCPLIAYIITQWKPSVL